MVYLVIIGGFILLGIFIWFLSRDKNDKGSDVIGQGLQNLNQRLDNIGNSVNQALRDTLKLVNEQLKEARESTERASKNVHDQVGGFTTGITELSEGLKQIQESVRNVSSFQDIFKSPKLRGIWGEASLEASLSQYFSKDNYQKQYYFKSGEIVDVVLHLPNDLLLPIDSKFNWENFEKSINADNEINREQYKRVFLSDVKKKIDEISQKYILPSEGTTDFALMYIPAETVYYEIVNNIKDVDLPSYAMAKKVFLVSPNTFMLSVSTIRHWFKDIQLNKQTKEIMKRLERIVIDGKKLGEDFKRLGKHLSDARGSYDDSEKRLELMVDRVQTILESGEKNEVEKIEGPK